jgi:putative MATE family efflux protein
MGYSFLQTILKGFDIMNQNDKKITLMREGKISAVLWRLGLPTIVGMLINSLYSIVDAYFVGGLGTGQQGAVAVVFPITQVIVGLGMTFGSGAASYISRLLGEKQDDRANQTASTSLFASLAVGAAAIAVSLIFLTPLLRSLGAIDEIMPYARGYAIIYITGSIFNIFNITMNNIVTAEGATKLTMVAMLTGAGLNAILDPIFIYPLGMGIEGAAWASVLAQAITSVIYLVYMLRGKGYLRIALRSFRFDGSIFAEVLKIGIPTFVFQLLSSICMGLSNNAASNFGASEVAAMGIVTRVMTLGSYVIFGYMKGFQPVAGFNYGAKLYGRLREAKRLSLLWSAIFCCGVSVLLIFFAPQIVSAFTQGDAAVLELGTKALRAQAAVFPFTGYVFIYMSLYLALGKAKEGGILSIARQGLFFIPAIMLLPRVMGINGIVVAQPLADLLTLALTLIITVPLKRTLKKLPDLGEDANPAPIKMAPVTERT